jgi:hypothetical protein
MLWAENATTEVPSDMQLCYCDDEAVVAQAGSH